MTRLYHHSDQLVGFVCVLLLLLYIVPDSSLAADISLKVDRSRITPAVAALIPGGDKQNQGTVLVGWPDSIILTSLGQAIAGLSLTVQPSTQLWFGYRWGNALRVGILGGTGIAYRRVKEPSLGFAHTPVWINNLKGQFVIDLPPNPLSLIGVPSYIGLSLGMYSHQDRTGNAGGLEVDINLYQTLLFVVDLGLSLNTQLWGPDYGPHQPDSMAHIGINWQQDFR